MSDVPARIEPASLRSAQFQGSFRKYDSKAVDQYLAALADQIGDLNRYIDDLEREVAAASRASALAEAPAPAPAAEPAPQAPEDKPTLRTLTDDEIATLVGEETAFVLGTARKAAEEIRFKAEESAARMIRESNDEAAAITEAAKGEVEGLRSEAAAAREVAVAEAETEASAIVERANADAERRVSEARTMADDELLRAERIRAETDEAAEAVRTEAKEEGRTMVNEAKEVRTRILEDLQRRRDLGRSQIARLVVGRDRMLEAYAAVRANVDEMTEELEHILDDPFEHDPALEEGFVGIVATATPSSDVYVEADAESEPDHDDTDTEPKAADLSADEVATEAEAEAEVEADSPTDEPIAESTEDTAHEPADDLSDEAQPEADADATSDTEDSQDPGTDDPGSDDTAEVSGGATDVDELFARMRADSEVTDEDDTAQEPAPEVDAVAAQYLASGEGYEHRSTVLAEADKTLPRALKRLLADEQNEVLDAIRRTESTDLAEVLPSADDHAERYANAATAVLEKVALSAASTVDADGSAVDVSELAKGLATDLVDPLRRRIERAAVDVDGDHEGLDERLRTLYREWKIDHIGRLSSDALISAYSAGLVAAAPEDAKVRWLIDPATGPCPDCQDNALEGAIDVGAEFPTGDTRPQAHPGCSCMLAVDA